MLRKENSKTVEEGNDDEESDHTRAFRVDSSKVKHKGPDLATFWCGQADTIGACCLRLIPAIMGCTLSGLGSLYDAVSTAQEVYLNDRRFKIVQQIGEGGYAFVYMVREVNSGLNIEEQDKKQNAAPDNLYALKKVLIQTSEQKTLVEKEIEAASRFQHPNLLPLLEHSIVKTKDKSHEAYLLFPLHRDGTVQEHLAWMTQKDAPKKERFTPQAVLQIFHQICAGLQAMHNSVPPYAHNDVKPGNVLLTRKGSQYEAVLMDFGSAAPARIEIRSRNEALGVQEWAAQHCTAPYRAPELWDCPSHADIDERTDIWSLGCTLFALMYGQSPFEYSLGEAGGSLQLAAMSGQVKWPPEAKGLYPESFHQFVGWMLQTNPTLRPRINDVYTHVERLLAKLAPSPVEAEP